MLASIDSKSSWVWLGLAVLLCNVFYASTQQVNRFHESNVHMAAGADGRVYLDMAKQLPGELPPSGIAPYVYRIGAPFAVAAVAKSQDWVIAAGFDRLDVICNVAAVFLLLALLRRSAASSFSAAFVILLFLTGPYWPTRYSYFHPLSVDSFVLLGVVGTLLAIEWFRDEPSLERALLVTVMTVAGVTIHELLLLPGLSMALAGKRNSAPRSWWHLVQAGARSYAWLPGLVGIGALIGLHNWITPTTSAFSWQVQFEEGLKNASAMRFGLAWFAVFGPVFGLALFRWRTTIGVLRARPDWSLCLVVLTALAWVAGVDRERMLVFASPIVFVMLARGLTESSALWTAHAAGALTVLQIIWTRAFLPIGAAVPDPELGSDAWARLGNGVWTLSTANLASQLWPPSVVRFNLWATIVTVTALIGFVSLRSDPRTLAGIYRSSWWTRLTAIFQETVRFATKIRPTVVVWTLTVGALAPIAWLALRHFYWTNYATASAEYLAYNLARIWLVVIMLGVFRSTGTRLIRLAGDARTNGANHIVDALVTGAAVWSIAVVLLATIHLYRAPIVMVLIAVGVRLAVGDRLSAGSTQAPLDAPSGWRKWINNVVILAIIAEVVAIAVTIVLWGNFGGDNDVPGNYLPYYESVMRAFANAPNDYWVHFFVSRGSGLAFLFNIVSDPQGAALASALMIVIGSAMLLKLVPRPGVATRLASLTGVLLLLEFYAGETAFVKSHIARNLFVAYIVISFARSLLTNEARSRQLQVSRLAALVAATVMSPITTALLLPLFAVELLMVARLIGRAEARRWLIYPATALGVSFAVCLFNFVTVGIPELSMMPPAVGKFADLDKLGRWLDPQISRVDERLAFLNPVAIASTLPTAVADAASPITTFLGILQSLASWPVAIFALVGCLAALISGGVGRKRLTDTTPALHVDRQRALAAVLYLGIVFVFVALVRILEPGQGSLQRFTAFTAPVAIAFGLVLLAFAAESARSVAQRRGVGLLLLVAVVVAVLAAPVTLLRLPWSNSGRFLFGALPYAAIYDPEWKTQAGWEVASAVPGGAKIELLSFLPGFTAIPSTPFQRPDGAAYLREYTTVLYGSEEEASSVYRRHGIDYFLVDLSPNVALVWSGYSSLFSTDAMRARLRPVSRFQIGVSDLYLFTWRSTGDVVDEKGYDEFLTAWEGKLASERAGGYFQPSYDGGRKHWQHESAIQQNSTR